jgi:hypothetical protein
MGRRMGKEKEKEMKMEKEKEKGKKMEKEKGRVPWTHSEQSGTMGRKCGVERL